MYLVREFNQKVPCADYSGRSEEPAFLLYMNWSCLDSSHHQCGPKEPPEEPRNHIRLSMPVRPLLLSTVNGLNNTVLNVLFQQKDVERCQ